MRFLICDIKRLFSKRSMIALFILAPAAVMVLFSSIVVPMLFTGRGVRFNLAILQEDNSLEVRSFVHAITRGKAVADLVDIYEVNSLDEGLELLDNQQVSVLVHVPSDIQGIFLQHETVVLSIYSSPAHAMEQSLIIMTLGESLLTVGQSKNQLEGVRDFLLDKGANPAEVDSFVRDMTFTAIRDYMGRRGVLGKVGTVSPLGDFLPIEYYLAAVFVLFAALAMLPLIHFTAADLSGSIFHRGLASGRGSIQFYLSRILSGAMFIMLVLLMVFPTSLLLGFAENLIGSAYQASLPALLAVICLISLGFSTLAATLAVWIGKEQPSLWTGFYLALFMAISGGALIPDGSLPDWLSGIGRWLPLRPAMRSLASALFAFDKSLFAADMLRLSAMSLAIFLIGFAGFVRKERSL